MKLPDNTLLHGGKYRITHFIASGGFGCTYEAEHVMLGKRVAIKEFFVKDFCNRDETTVHVTVGTQSRKPLVDKLKKKFIDEARAISGLSHSGIVAVSDVFEENGTAYYVMDYIDGETISGILKRDGVIAEAQAVKYIRHVCDALDYVHKHNRLHLDIKPANIMVDSHGNAILIDFGASKQYDEESGENTSTLSSKTPGYAPAEQMGNDVSHFSVATDIYSLGATLYKMLTGVTPPEATIRVSGVQLPPLPASVSVGVKSAVYSALQLNKDNRPQNITEFLRLLDSKEDKSEDTLIEVSEIEKPKEEPEIEEPKDIKNILSKLLINKKLIATAIALVAMVIGLILLDNKNESGKPSEEATTADLQTDIIEGEDDVEEVIVERAKKFHVKGVSFTMVHVEGGTYEMGASDEQKNGYTPAPDESPVHTVTLDDYYIGQTEVTQELWKTVMGASPSAKYDWTSEFGLGAKYPAYYISYDDCQEFINRLDSITGEKFRMPTEAEWEYAARGGKKSSGYIFSGSNTIGDVASFSNNSRGHTNEVSIWEPNELGIYDMSGNVWEWCSDRYGEYNSNPQTNPTGCSTDVNRVFRGGGFGNNASKCRVSYRGYSEPGFCYCTIGLRLALSSSH